MTNVYSVDEEIRNIYSQKTRDNFEEVQSSYAIGNYRSAVVMLWSVVVCDTLYKLQDAIDLFNDEVAEGIVSEIKDMQKADRRNSAWEEKLLTLVRERTDLLSSGEYENLLSIKQCRHLSAHPVIDSSYDLYKPTMEFTRAHIRNALECLLTKSGFHTKKTVDYMLVEIENHKTLLNSKDKMSSFLKSRYFKKIGTQGKEAVFRSLWKVVFSVLNPRATANREANYNAIWALFEYDEVSCIEAIRKEPQFYSKISPEIENLTCLLRILTTFPNIYIELNDDAKEVIKNAIDTNIQARLLSTFLYEDIDSYYRATVEWLDSKNVEENHEPGQPSPLDKEPLRIEVVHLRILESALKRSDVLIVNKIAAKLYSLSISFSSADRRYAILEPFLTGLNTESITELLNEVEENNQIHSNCRRWVDNEIRSLFNQARAVGVENFQSWPNLGSRL